MLDFLINFLQKRKEKQILKKRGKIPEESNLKKGFLIFFGLVFLCFSFFYQYLEIDKYDGHLISLFTLKQIISFLIKYLLIFTLYGAYKKKENIFRYFYLIFFPLLLVSMFMIIPDENAYVSLLIYLTIIFPILNILKINKLEKIKKLAFIYNIGFYIFLSIYIFLLTIGFEIKYFEPFGSLTLELLSEEEFILLPLLFFVLTYPIYSLHIYFDESKNSKNSVKKGAGLFLLISFFVFIGNLIPDFIDDFYKGQIRDTKEIIKDGGENYNSYSKARGQWFLEKAFLNKIKEQGELYSYDLELFNKIYDSTPENYFGEKIAEYTNNRRSFETNLTKVGEKADVVLSLAQIENKISSDNSSNFATLETTYKFNFTNQKDINQEVVIYFETPSKNSVISDLKLGLNLELQGQIAPRGAARKVYEDSLRKNIDPAIIEKVGLNTYSLKVFPIPSKNNSKNRGKQLVQLKILTPIFNKKDTLEYSPKFSFTNLKFDKNSGIISKIYNNEELKKEDIVEKDDIEQYLTTSHKLNLDNYDINLKKGEYCIDKDILNYVSKIKIEEQKEELNKIAIFFDNSASISNNDVDDNYTDIFKNIKNYNGKLQDVDLYRFNSKIDKVLSINNIKYWGNSNISSVVNYIDENNFKNTRIIIVTDDDNYDIGIYENKNINYKSLTSNKISVISFGEKIKKFKSEFNNILAVTNGNIYKLDLDEDILATIDKIFITNSSESKIKVITCEKEKTYSNSNKIWAGYIGNKLLSNISNNYDWEQVANQQNFLAENFGIVNQFNSYIALETEQQQRDLDRYKKKSDRYDTEYKNYGKSKNVKIERRKVDSGILQGSSNDDTWGLEGSNSIKYCEGNSCSLKSYNEDYNENSGFNFSINGGTDLSIYGMILILIYIVQFYSIISFIIKYIKEGEEIDEIIEE